MSNITYVIVELVFGLIGVILAKFLLANPWSLVPRVDKTAVVQASLWTVPLLAFAFFFNSSVGLAFPPFQSIYRSFRDSPMREFLVGSGIPLIVLWTVSAGICEELLFRGVLQTKWGIVIACLIFAGVHAISLPLFATTFFIGLYLAYAFKRTGNNLFVCAVAHAAYDFTFTMLLRKLIVSGV